MQQRQRQQQVCAVPSSSANSVNPKSPFGSAVRSEGQQVALSPTDLRLDSICHDTVSCLDCIEPNVNSPEEEEEWFPTWTPPHRVACWQRPLFPQLQGTAMTKLSKLI